MSKRVLLLTLAVLMAVGIYTAVAEAGVEGSFTFDIYMWPQTTAVEVSKFDFDFEGLLELSITLSGLTFSNDLAIGIAGLEHYIGSVETTLGALTVVDEFVFARPYIGMLYPWPSKWLPGNVGTPVGNMLFVKKRAYAEMTIGGLTFTNLAMFEDVNFPEPWDTTFTDTNLNGEYDSADQDFRFGDIVGISGTTVSGITVTAETGFCAEWRIRPAYYFLMGGKHYFYKQLEYALNVIKKAAWIQEVVPCEPNASFFKEYLAIEGITISDILSLDVYSIVAFTPVDIFTAIESTVDLFGMGTLYLWMELVTPKDLYIESGSNPLVFLTLGPGLTIVWADSNNTLAIDTNDLVIFDSSMELQGVSFANYLEVLVGTGLNYMHNEVDIPISYPEPIGELTIDAEWYRDAATGHLKFEDIDIGIVKSFGEHNEFGINAAFNEDFLYGVNIWTTVSFSL